MQAGGAGETIRYAIASSALGHVLVATTARGLCAVLFDNSEADSDSAAAASLVIDLRARFPQAVLRRDDAALSDAVSFTLSRLTETPSAAAMPFHVRATAFQQRVWSALMAIPRGQTRTYAQIAATIGAPKAVRAVGAAIGANPLAVIVL
jgi:AraC family transcriptional regulator of adaptative response/methylated-DNA-[protein]-cysteine methyltransferase